ncbi:HNH endonuclease [Nocardioides sp. OK12]|uniref:HNH endonuclease n=1 Tax=Nocardioides sp. OK12 TaxID=2758661 RepID=UPI0021C4A919|nr:HNH endonuclease signature motif containing protein [Nocardioides sp. OK12]GHJ57614.1 HNH endonuclease [Nocardioides sp. OK12]
MTAAPSIRDLAALGEAELVEALRAAEEQKCRLDALQVELTARLDEVVRRRHAAAGLPTERQGVGVASQVGLARRESPNRGARHLGLAKILVAEMPHTLAAMRAGWCSEWRATLLARETACLSLEDRRRVDAELMADPETTEGWGDKRLVAAARARAYELDPHAALKRSRKAEGERYVSLRPAPDTMTYLTALLPVAQGVAAYAALTRAADSARASGDERSRGQVMADTLVTSVLTDRVEPAPVPVVPVAVNLTVSDATLLGGGHQPGWVAGYGPVPAGFARELVATAIADAQATLRRLYTTSAGALVAMDSRARTFPASLGLFIDLRDQSCRTPWCDAPIRHHDHVVPDHAGGPTSATNGQGLCEACNQAKEAPGFTATTVRSTVVTTTPTGHQVPSRAPDLPPGDPPVTPEPSRPRVDILHPRLQIVLDDYTPAA